jgi:hypothetical protein
MRMLEKLDEATAEAIQFAVARGWWSFKPAASSV